MMDAEKRTYTIKHNRYDDNGNLIETYDKEFTTNETDDKIFITREWCLAQAKENVNTSKGSSAWTNNYGKQAYYESGDVAIAIDGYKEEHDGFGYTKFTFQKTGGGEFEYEYENGAATEFNQMLRAKGARGDLEGTIERLEAEGKTIVR